MIFDFKARGGGYFRVYVRQEEFLSQHSDEREAAQQCVNAYLADPTCKPYYRHEGPELGSTHLVDLIVTDVDGTIVLPPPPTEEPPPPPAPAEDAWDLLDAIASVAPDPTYEIKAASFEASLQVFADRHTDMWIHALLSDPDPVTGKRKLLASAWKGIVIVWKWSQISLLGRNKT